MATLHAKAGVGYAGVSFGIATEEGTNLITQKVSVSKKIKKKDLRGKDGGYKSIVSFGETIEYSIEGALISGTNGGFVLAAAYVVTNDPFTVGATELFVESLTINEKNDDFKKISTKLVGSVFLSA